MMQSFVILLVGSAVADYPYYTDYNSYNSVYAPTSSNISSRLSGIKRTWNPDGPFTFGLSKQLLKLILLTFLNTFPSPLCENLHVWLLNSLSSI